MLRRAVVMGGVAMTMIASLTLAQQPKRQGRGGFGFGGPGGQGSGAMLLATPEVRKELGTSDEQNKQIDGLLEDLQEQMRASGGNINFQELQNLSQEERQKRIEEARKKRDENGKKTDEKLSKILEPKQTERLKQLRMQREGAGAFGREEIAKELGLSKEQQDKIRKIQEDSRPQGGGGAANVQNLSDEERRELRTKMQERVQKAQKDMLVVLTEEQKKKWEAMKGKEFKFPEGRGGFGGAGAGGPGGEQRKRSEPKKGN